MHLHNCDCRDIRVSCDVTLTDPPFDMDGDALASVLRGIECQHFVLLTTMRQYTGLMRSDASLRLAFDFVLDTVAPKKSKSKSQPHYTHVTGVYLTRCGGSKFNRKLRERSDTFDGKGYWPTVFHAPSSRGGSHSLAKSLSVVTDVLGSFEGVSHVYDPFAGSGTTGIAALELGIEECTLVESDGAHFTHLQDTFSFLKTIQRGARR